MSAEAFPGTLHRFAPPLVAFEYSTPTSIAPLSIPTEHLSTVVFVGGLFDNLLTVPFAHVVAHALPSSWRFMQATLSSSGPGWGTSNLDTDVSELSQLVAYVRRLRSKGKVVLLGHSTGSQDTLHYLSSPGASSRAPLDGAILQAPASDREGMDGLASAEALAESIRLAKELVEWGKEEELLPRHVLSGMPPLTAERWLSLASPGPAHDGEDDMFSSDLPDERLKKTFGKAAESKVPLMLLYSAEDEHVPAFVDKEALVARWSKAVKDAGGNVHGESGVVPGMDHNGKAASDEAKAGLAKRVVAFVNSL